jgi:hypothetical protein
MRRTARSECLPASHSTARAARSTHALRPVATIHLLSCSMQLSSATPAVSHDAGRFADAPHSARSPASSETASPVSESDEVSMGSSRRASQRHTVRSGSMLGRSSPAPSVTCGLQTRSLPNFRLPLGTASASITDACAPLILRMRVRACVHACVRARFCERRIASSPNRAALGGGWEGGTRAICACGTRVPFRKVPRRGRR